MNMTTIKSDRYQQDKVLSAVLSAGSILLFCHVSPDGDTLGSALALKIRLQRLGKRVQLMMDGFVPSYLAFLPEAEDVLAADAQPKQYDLAVAVDVASLDRLGKCETVFASAPMTAVIDHHGTNEGYAQLNLIDGDAPATAILICRLFEKMELPMTQEEALCLYTALSTDTGNFIYDSTNAESFAVMGRLMEAGLPLAEYSRKLFRQKEEAFVRLLGEALPTLRVIGDGKIAGLQLTLAQMEKHHANGGHTEGIVNYAIDLMGVDMAYFAREMDGGKVKVSLRALDPYAVDKVAAQFGGGGHRLAAGLTLEMPIADAVRTIEAALEAAL